MYNILERWDNEFTEQEKLKHRNNHATILQDLQRHCTRVATVFHHYGKSTLAKLYQGNGAFKWL